MDIELTQDAEYLLCELYRAYVTSRKNGEPAEISRAFGSSERIQKDCIQDWPTHDIDYAAHALCEEGMLEAIFEADELVESFLTNRGIAYMEHRFGRKLDTLLQRLATLRTVLLG